MRALLALALLPLAAAPAHAQGGAALDTPGLVTVVSVETGGYEFDVSVTANLAVSGHEFDAGEKRLTLLLDSSVEDALAEIVIPADLIGGNLTFYLDGEEVRPVVRSTEEISFATVRFSGSGERRLDIVGTTYLPELPAAALALAAAMAGPALLGARRAGALLVKQRLDGLP